MYKIDSGRSVVVRQEYELMPLFKKFPAVGRLGLWLGSGPHVVGRLGSAMRVSASFQLCGRSLYIDWRMVVVVGREMSYTM